MSLCCSFSKLVITDGVSFAALSLRASSSFSPLVLPSVASSRSTQASFHTFAKKKRAPVSSFPQDDDDEQVLDEDFRNSINQLSTEAIKAMLSDNMKHMEDLREKLFDLEIFLEKENEKDALCFVLVIRDMLDHKILPEAKQLKGVYRKAFQKICNMVEDSGWHLKGSDEDSELGMIDDDLIPPTLMTEYR